MKPTASTPKSLPPSTGSLPAKPFEELSSEEAVLRHRLELRVERALYRAAVVLQAVHARQDSSCAHHYLDRGWDSEEKVQRAWSEVEIALQELRKLRLYRSTHQSFERYFRERFGSFVYDYSPVLALEA